MWKRFFIGSVSQSECWWKVLWCVDGSSRKVEKKCELHAVRNHVLRSRQTCRFWPVVCGLRVFGHEDHVEFNPTIAAVDGVVFGDGASQATCDEVDHHPPVRLKKCVFLFSKGIDQLIHFYLYKWKCVCLASVVTFTNSLWPPFDASLNDKVNV